MSELKVTAKKARDIVALFATDDETMTARVAEVGALGGLNAKDGASEVAVYDALCAPLGAAIEDADGFSRATVGNALSAYRMAHGVLGEAAPAQYALILRAIHAVRVKPLRDAWDARIAKANAKTDAERVALFAKAKEDAKTTNAKAKQSAKDAKAKTDAAKANAKPSDAPSDAPAESAPAEPKPSDAPKTPSDIAESILASLSAAREYVAVLSAADALRVADAAEALRADAAARANAEATAEPSAEAPAESEAPKPRAPRRATAKAAA